jgi:hypothetical protein
MVPQTGSLEDGRPTEGEHAIGDLVEGAARHS